MRFPHTAALLWAAIITSAVLFSACGGQDQNPGPDSIGPDPTMPGSMNPVNPIDTAPPTCTEAEELRDIDGILTCVAKTPVIDPAMCAGVKPIEGGWQLMSDSSTTLSVVMKAGTNACIVTVTGRLNGEIEVTGGLPIIDQGDTGSVKLWVDSVNHLLVEIKSPSGNETLTFQRPTS